MLLLSGVPLLSHAQVSHEARYLAGRVENARG